jgi:hypothetical protein
MSEPTRYLRSTVSNQIYEWNPILAANKRCVEITELEAYPERFQPVGHKGRTSKVSTLITEDEVVAATEAKRKRPELSAEASANLPGSPVLPRGKN